VNGAEPGTRRSRQGYAIGAIALLAVGITTTVLVRNAGPEQDADAAPRPPAPASAGQPTSDAGSAPAPQPAEAAAGESGAALTGFLGLTDAVLGGTGPTAADLDAVAAGYAKGEVEATQSEFVANGWHQEGVAAVTDVRTESANLAADPPTATVRVCIDSAGVRVVDAEGQVVSQRPPGTNTRIPHLYTMVLSGGAWKATDHTFPPEPSC